jgi:hypothetical protein
MPSSPAIRSSSHRSIESSSPRLRHHARNFDKYEMAGADFGSEIDMASSNHDPIGSTRVDGDQLLAPFNPHFARGPPSLKLIRVN